MFKLFSFNFWAYKSFSFKSINYIPFYLCAGSFILSKSLFCLINKVKAFIHSKSVMLVTLGMPKYVGILTPV